MTPLSGQNRDKLTFAPLWKPSDDLLFRFRLQGEPSPGVCWCDEFSVVRMNHLRAVPASGTGDKSTKRLPWEAERVEKNVPLGKQILQRLTVRDRVQLSAPSRTARCT